MLIKVSYIRDLEQVGRFCELGIDYLSFDFCGNSSRFFAQKSGAATFEIPRKIKRVGIFDSSSELYVISLAGQLGLTSVQMDGGQDARFCEKIAAEGLEIIKTFTPDTIFSIGEFEGVCNKFVLRGFKFDLLLGVKTQTPFFVEGDLPIFEQLKGFDNGAFVGLDTGYGFESAIAVKDMDAVMKLLSFRG